MGLPSAKEVCLPALCDFCSFRGPNLARRTDGPPIDVEVNFPNFEKPWRLVGREGGRRAEVRRSGREGRKEEERKTPILLLRQVAGSSSSIALLVPSSRPPPTPSVLPGLGIECD